MNNGIFGDKELYNEHRDKVVDIKVIRGAVGDCISVSNKRGGYRLAGPKTYGGGTTIHKFTVSLRELIEHATVEAYYPDSHSGKDL